MIPESVVEWVRTVFAECNRRVTVKMDLMPNVPEPSLDMTWVEHFSRFSVPIQIGNSWFAKIETHYLGGLRHYLNKWEIADIGVLLFVRENGVLTMSKVLLLQSKRLYPSSGTVREDLHVDYHIGFGRLADPEDLQASIAVVSDFCFNDDCRYGALVAASEQVVAIRDYSKVHGLEVYYQLYNPWETPITRRIPVSGYSEPIGKPPLGVRVLTSTAVHSLMQSKPDGYRPSLADVKALGGNGDGGKRLEDFIADGLLGCTEGNSFENVGDMRIQSLFYRRSGPIAAAVSIVLERVGEE